MNDPARTFNSRIRSNRCVTAATLHCANGPAMQINANSGGTDNFTIPTGSEWLIDDAQTVYDINELNATADRPKFVDSCNGDGTSNLAETPPFYRADVYALDHMV